MIRIIREEGPLTLWRGCGPTVLRAVVVNASQLATYSQSKEIVLNSGYVEDGIMCHLLASMISGIATTVLSMPVDIAKTRFRSSLRARNAFILGVSDSFSTSLYQKFWAIH
ncbi:unnamed protein product [Toxocara canis]|uniref:Uncharacterized protein n=1 Tax=Toxocara canis TaxID=6265 RepID=A0A3P7F2Y3_TOXCA|nr:unnamed protein product [Toxocara canis]